MIEFLFAIGIPEEPRVTQSCGEHALEVFGDQLGLVSLHVENREEGRLQLPLLADHWEEVLMVNHRRGEHFFGQREKFLRERAGDHGWVFDQIRHLAQECLRHQVTRDAAASTPRFDIELAGNAIRTFIALEDHEVLGQPLAVIVEALDLDRAPGASAGGQEPMAKRDRARTHFLDERALRQRRAIQRERHDTAAVQKEDPSDRPAKRQFALAVLERGIPPHGLRERELAQQTAEDVGQHVDGGLSAQLFLERQIGALRRLDALERGHLNALLLGKSLGRGCWFAVRAKGR